MGLASRVRALIPPPLQDVAIVLKDGLRSAVLRGWYSGGRLECPACGARANAFATFRGGRTPAPNEVCPCCKAHSRHRLMALFLERRTRIYKDPIRLLHMAPELVFWMKFRSCPSIQYVTSDLGSPYGAVPMDLTRGLFADATFDVIICNHVLEHIPDDRAAMRELLRMLKPGGWALLQVPMDWSRAVTEEDWSVTSPEERRRRFGQHDHVRNYGADYVDRLTEAGFRVEVDDFVRELPREDVERFRLMESERIVIGHRPAV